MNKKIVFLDVDGTLTTPTGEISDRVKSAIQQARENGHYVYICTGRNKSGIASLMDTKFDGIICSAGGYIEIDGEFFYESFLDEEEVLQAREIFTRNNVMYNLEATHLTFSDEKMTEMFSRGALNKEHTNSELNRLIQEQKDRFNIHGLEEYDEKPVPIHKICFIALNEESLKEPRLLLSDKYNFIIHDMFSIDSVNGEIIIKDTNKGTAVKQVVEALNLSMEDTICFGDSMNDFEMIQVCHHSVVMGNGSDELKKHATTICESVEDDGIYHELKRLNLI